MERILKGFKNLILENRASLSLLQEYTLELYQLFYTICLRFKRSSLKTLQFSLYQRHSPTLLDLTDINNLIDIHQVLPDAITVIQNTLNYLSTTKPTDNNEEYKSILPRGIIISALDAAAQVLMYAYQLEPSEQIRYYLDLTLNILSEDSIWCDWGTADILKRVIQDFLSQHLSSIISESSSSFDWLIPPSIPYSIEENRPWIQDILTTDVLSIESFFDGLLF
ncbi:hypothetical protein BD770DRAFT_212637 [Pilaira anomala]|nr:hypothetical protein BD770DRAFT_212637 [Pilaira anomala]